MAFNPCFSMDIRKGVKILASVDIFFSLVATIGLVYVIGAVFFVTNFGDFSSSSDKNKPMGVGGALLSLMTELFGAIGQFLVTLFLFVAAVVLLYAIIQLILAALLFSGGNQRNHRRCKIWFVITIIFTIINAVICCASLAIDDKISVVITLFFFNFIRLVFTIYEIVVVRCFLKELRSEESSTANSDDEVKEGDSTHQQPGIELSDLSQCPPPDYSSVVECQIATAPKMADLDQ